VSAPAVPPRVTVVLAAYQAARVVGQALEQALGQTLTAIEVVVVDDGSRDGTAAAARRAAAGDPRVRVVRKENGGVASARNLGVEEARGEYVAFLASCYSALVDESGRMLGWRVGDAASGDAYGRMLERDVVSGGSVAVVRRAALLQVGGFDESLPMRSDWDLWIRLARRYPVVTVPETLVGYTRSGSGASRHLAVMERAGQELLARAAVADGSLDERRLRFLRARDTFAVACFALFDEQPRAAWRYLRRSLRLTPAPVLRSPRRWAIVAAMLLLTVLPRGAYRAVLGRSGRVVFGIRAGEPFPP
jgi:GT2 family glycosyltransferase